MILREERPKDRQEIETLYDLCFAPGRKALSSYRLRGGTEPIRDLSRLAFGTQGGLMGAVRYWPIQVAKRPALLLGPVAVHPIHQGEGIGAMLIRDSLHAAMHAGWKRVLLVGDVPYYGRFGFVRLRGVEMPQPTNPERVLGLELVPGAWRNLTGQAAPANSPRPDHAAGN